MSSFLTLSPAISAAHSSDATSPANAGVLFIVFYMEFIMSGLVIAWAIAEQARTDRYKKQQEHARKCKATD